MRVPNVPEAGPVFAGNQVLWADGRADGGIDLKTAPRNGGRPRLVQSFPGKHHYLADTHVAASDQRWAVQIVGKYLLPPVSYVQPSWNASSYAGPIGSPLAALYPGCPNVAAPGSPIGSLAVDGSTIGFTAPPCLTDRPGGGQPGSTRVEDFSVIPPKTTALSPGASAIRLAGRYAAWGEGTAYTGTLLVFDLATKSAALSLAPSPQFANSSTGGGLQSLSLQSDGTMAFSYLAGSRERLAWVSIREPRIHPVALQDSGLFSVKLAGGLVALVSRPRYVLDQGVDSGQVIPDDNVLTVRDLSGHLIRTVAKHVSDAQQHDRMDFDGRQVAFVTRGCDAAQIHVDDITSPASHTQRPRRCRLRLKGPPRLVQNGGLKLKLDCRGFTGTCALAYAKATARVHGRPITIAEGHPVSDATRPVLDVTDQAAGPVYGRHGHLRLTITAVERDTTGSHAQRRRGNFTLRH